LADRCEWDLYLLELLAIMKSLSPKMCIIIIVIVLIINLVFESVVCVIESVVKQLQTKFIGT